MPIIIEDPIAHFWSRVDKSGECWIWTGSKTRGGYGHLTHQGKQIYAHRFAFEITYGTVLPGMHICHACDNPPCCNPAHLFVGTVTDNVADRDRKGRGKWDSGETRSARARAQWADPVKRAKLIAGRQHKKVGD